MRPIAIISIMLFAVLCACSTPSPAGSDAPSPIRFSGTVVFVPLEGGFYGIVAADGRRYDPVNLDEEFRRDGLSVMVVGRLLSGTVGYHQWGAAIEIVEIRRR